MVQSLRCLKFYSICFHVLKLHWFVTYILLIFLSLPPLIILFMFYLFHFYLNIWHDATVVLNFKLKGVFISEFHWHVLLSTTNQSILQLFPSFGNLCRSYAYWHFCSLVFLFLILLLKKNDLFSSYLRKIKTISLTMLCKALYCCFNKLPK